jgi:dTMP kinase
MTWYVVDGLDGSGKSTVAEMIKDISEGQGRSAYIRHHPSESLPGRLSRHFLKGEGKAAETIATVFYIMDVLLSLTGMGRLRRQYDDLVFVRYSMAAAYLPERIMEPAYTIIEKVLPRPDRLILVDVDPDVAMSRILERGEELELFESIPRLNRVRDKMMTLARHGWEVVDNSRCLQEIHDCIQEIVE